MKKQFLLVVASVITMTAQAQDGQQATLVHGATTTIFDGTEALQQALSAAAHGDSIRLSAGDFAAADITKAVHIRGAGFNASVPDSLTQLNGDFTVSVDSTAGRMSLEGVFSSSTMQVGLLRNACFQNCRLGTITPKDSVSTMRGTEFVKCKVVSGFNLSANSSASCHNSYIGRPICMNDSNSVFFFNNCMIRGWNEYLGYALKSSYLLNSILIWESSPKSAGNQDPRNFFDTSNRVYNVLGFSCWELHTNHAYSMFDNVGGYDTGDHWWLDPRYTFIFASGSSGWNYSDSETYELTETAQTTYIGLDGTQIGMHGGAYPFDNGASYPEVATDNSTRPMILQAYKNTLDGAKEANYPVFRYDSIYSVAETLSSDQLIAVFDELCTGIHTSNFMREAQGTEYPIFYVPTHGQVWTRNSSGNGAWIRTSIDGNGQQALTAYVDLDQDAVLRYEVWNSDTDVENMLYIDDQPARFVSHAQAKRDEWYQFARVPAGRHTLRWVWTNLSSTANNGVAYYGGLYAAPLISVNLETAGSLGNEVLYHVDNIDQVRRLKITGPMNSDDFARIDMMTKLMELDLSETDVTSIPAQQFDRYDAKKNSTQWLYKVTLPHNLVSIGNYAFRYSYVYEMDFPQTLKSIGNYALESTHLYKAVLPDSLDTLGEGVFYNNQNLQEVILPDSMTSLGQYMFYNCSVLQTVKYPANQTSIPYRQFYAARELTNMTLPEGLVSVADEAFYGAWSYKAKLPTTLQSIGVRSFRDCYATDTITLNRGMYIGAEAFRYCNIRNLEIPEEVTFQNGYNFGSNKLKSISFPTTYYTANESSPVFSGNTEIETITLKSPTMVVGSYKTRFIDDCGSQQKTIRVPQHMVNIYKQDNYWYNFNIVGFPSSDVEEWYLNQPLTLTSRDRLEGSPSLTMYAGGWLTINGDAPMALNNLTTFTNMDDRSLTAQAISHCDNINVDGQAAHFFYGQANRWYFNCLPFNFRISTVKHDADAKFAIYTYNGANRAENGNGNNWTRMEGDDIVTAGTGFILQTSKTGHTWFYAMEDGDKQNIMSTNEFAKALESNPAEDSQHKGWNLVGNPYLCYYNLHKLNFTAPITTWTGSTYKAYSIIDDDYALRPLVAFFVQCPDEVTSLSLPVAGKQFDATISDQNGMPARRDQQCDRLLIDLCLSHDGEHADETRVVLNQQASLAYETSRDAGKFASLDTHTPQLFTIGTDGTRYAINERPMADGTVMLGFTAPQSGTYTLSVKRNRAFGQVSVLDRQTGTRYDITENEYTFHAEAGTDTQRLVLMATEATGISDTTAKHGEAANNNVYDLSGRIASQSAHRGIYIEYNGGKTRKVVR